MCKRLLKENSHSTISEVAEKVASLTGLPVSSMFKIARSINPLVRFMFHKKASQGELFNYH
jgi:hypothetical protein